jgi:hypothetical protein
MLKLGILSDLHIALIEFKQKSTNGTLTSQEISQSKFNYYDTSSIQHGLVSKGALLRTVEINNDPSHRFASNTYRYTVTPEGEEFLRKKQANRRSYFNIRSDKLKRALWCILAKVEKGYTDFERSILVSHNALDAADKLTRVGERFAFKELPVYLSYFLYDFAWTGETGPNMTLYLHPSDGWRAAPDFSRWRTALKADFTLLKSIKGVGVTLMAKLDPKHKSYAKLVLSASTYEDAVGGIVEAQLRNPDAFVFCDTTDEDIHNWVIRKGGLVPVGV